MKKYYSTEDLLQSNIPLIIFGCGEAGNVLYENIKNHVKVDFFIDNNSNENGSKFKGISIIKPEELLLYGIKNHLIVIATYKYSEAMWKQAVDLKLNAYNKVVIWDDGAYRSNNDSASFIKLMQNCWDNSFYENPKKIILVYNICSTDSCYSWQAACMGNYLANKHKARLVGYTNDIVESNIPEVRKAFYESCGIKDFVKIKLTKAQLQESECILEKIWSKIEDWSDFYNIKFYGILWGSCLIRAYLRHYQLDLDVRSQMVKDALKELIKIIVFWKHYFDEHEIACVLLGDGVCFDGFIREIAVAYGVDAYITYETVQKAGSNHHIKPMYPFFAEFWDDLSDFEKKFGLKWAETHLNRRLKGDSSDLLNKWDAENFSFAEKITATKLTEDNRNVKILICPHIFGEDSCIVGGNIFHDNYIEWLVHLGKLSKKHTKYDWYIKEHPQSSFRDFQIIDMLIEKYPRLHRLPMNISPMQLYNEGVRWALTIHGSIGHEYPLMGINVINAGSNPHEAFNFTYNPKSIQEYDDLIDNLDSNEGLKFDKSEIYKFYALNYLFYDWNRYKASHLFYKKEVFGACDMRAWKALGKRPGTWVYKEFVDTYEVGDEIKMMEKMPELFRKIDTWKPSVFLKKENIIYEEEILKLMK